jgi:hypothetical protein
MTLTLSHIRIIDAFSTPQVGLSSASKRCPHPYLQSVSYSWMSIWLTPEAVERRTGLASILSSIFVPPLKLWERT